MKRRLERPSAAFGTAHSLPRGIGAIVTRHRDPWSAFSSNQRAKAIAQPVSAAGALSQDCLIKGNVNREGERIYHLPGGLNYAKVNIAAPGKRWFCTEAEAEAAGWRPAKR
jgi:hypothetical protein